MFNLGCKSLTVFFSLRFDLSNPFIQIAVLSQASGSEPWSLRVHNPIMSQLAVPCDGNKRQRSDRQKLLRSQREKFQRQCNQKLPKNHEWLYGLASDAELALQASSRLAAQEAAGIGPLVGRVLGHGDSPSDCIANLDGAFTPDQLKTMDGSILYQRLCEMEALKAEVSRQMILVMDAMLQRKLLHAEMVEGCCSTPLKIPLPGEPAKIPVPLKICEGPIQSDESEGDVMAGALTISMGANPVKIAHASNGLHVRVETGCRDGLVLKDVKVEPSHDDGFSSTRVKMEPGLDLQNVKMEPGSVFQDASHDFKDVKMEPCCEDVKMDNFFSV